MRYTDKKKLKSNKQKAYEFFISKGYTPSQSSGIVGNLIQESGLKSGITSNFQGEGSFGIAQWNPSEAAGFRLQNLQQFAKEKGTSPGDFNTQLEFIAHELDTQPHLGKKDLLNANTVEEAALVFSSKYERPSKKYAHNDKRIKNANEVFLSFNDENIYSKDEKGNIVVLNPEFATPEDISVSPTIKKEFYESIDIGTPQADYNPPSKVEEAKQEVSKVQKETEFKNNIGSILSGLNKTQEEPEPTLNSDTYSQSPDVRVQENEFFKFFSEGGTVNTDPTDPKKLIDPRKGPKRKSPKDPREEGVTRDRTEINPPNFKAGTMPTREEYDEDFSGMIPVQELEEVVITANREEIRRRKLAETKKDIETDYIDTRYQEGINENISGKEDIKKVQEFLIEKGYDLDPNNKFRNAGADGILGKVTKGAIQEYNKGINTPTFYKSTKVVEKDRWYDKSGKGFLGECSEKQCSEYVQNEIYRTVAQGEFGLTPEDRLDWNKRIGITGNAWDLGNNIIKAGGRQVELTEIKPGDIVGIHSGTEGGYLRRAEAAGRNYTHTGIVDEVNPDGSYYVLHNWHKKIGGELKGQEYRTLVQPGDHNLPGFYGKGVQEAFRPNYSGKPKSKVKAREDIKVEKAGLGFIQEDVEEFIKPINDVELKDKMINRFGIEEKDYYSIALAAAGIMGQETKFGNDIRYSTGAKRIGATFLKKMGNTDLGLAVEELTGYKFKSDEVSRGPGSMKLNTNFNGAEISAFGVNKDNINQPDKAMTATMVKLVSDFKYFKKKGETDEDALYKAIQKYNGSLNTKSKGKTRHEWAEDYDLDYSNKVLNFAIDLNVKDSEGNLLKTYIDDLASKKNVVKWADKIKNRG